MPPGCREQHRVRKAEADPPGSSTVTETYIAVDLARPGQLLENGSREK